MMELSGLTHNRLDWWVAPRYTFCDRTLNTCDIGRMIITRTIKRFFYNFMALYTALALLNTVNVVQYGGAWSALDAYSVLISVAIVSIFGVVIFAAVGCWSEIMFVKFKRAASERKKKKQDAVTAKQDTYTAKNWLSDLKNKICRPVELN